MPQGFVDALGYGVLGLCAIALVLVWRVLQKEQSREGQPRGEILRATYVFMGFIVALALVNGYVQLGEDGQSAAGIADLQRRLRTAEDKLLEIRSAASPIVRARTNILEELPPGPARNTLATLIGALRETLN